MNRREKLEALLADSPEDSFLQYALALELAAAGDDPGAAERMTALLDQDPHYVAAYFQLAQIVVRGGDHERARQLLVRGIEAARRAGDDHAESEMRGYLEQLAANSP